MANDAVKSASITNLDTVPIIVNNAGQGQSGRRITVDDYCTVTAAGIGSSLSYYKIVRVPTGALVKSVWLASDAALDASSTKTLALDVSWIFSDSTDDGTPTWLQGLIPQSGNTGTTTTIIGYTSPNRMYGRATLLSNTLPLAPVDITFSGLGTNYAFTSGFMNKPLYELFGFTDGRGKISDPGGYFDLLLFVATGAATGAAGNIYASVTYVI
jgi:hypothetical protein